MAQLPIPIPAHRRGKRGVLFTVHLGPSHWLLCLKGEAVIDLPDTLVDQIPADVVFLVAGQLDPSINTTATIREIEPQAQSATRTRRARLTLETRVVNVQGGEDAVRFSGQYVLHR